MNRALALDSAPFSAPDSGAFDLAAGSYDAQFTHSLLGRWLRDAVMERLEDEFAPGDRILELGCGTGEDAVRLARRGVMVTATDGSNAMLSVARRKAEASEVTHLVDFARFDLAADLSSDAVSNGVREEIAAVRSAGPYDGALSNFGALNCVRDRTVPAGTLAGMLRPGARVALVVMGPICLWEIAWHLAHREPRRAFRRLHGGTSAHAGGGATTPVWYPSPGRLRRELAPWFHHRGTVGVGVLLPPSYLAGLVERHAPTFARLGSIERRLAPHFPWRSVGDHYLSLFERR